MQSYALRAVGLPLVVFLGLTAPGPVAADPTSSAHPAEFSLKRRSEILILRDQGEDLRGRFVRFEEATGAIVLNRFVSEEGRFRHELVPRGSIREIRKVERKSTMGLPVIGALTGLALGGTVGYAFGEDRLSGDVQTADTRFLMAGFGAIAGTFFGFVGGAIAAPRHTVESTVWNRAFDSEKP